MNAVITDRRTANLTPSSSNPSTWEAVVINTSDYYPFGMQMPNRSNSYGAGVAYRYAYNGMETDGEVSGNGNSYTTEFRQYDPRLGRWKSLDPLMAKFPWASPYNAFDNNPIFFVDSEGDYSIQVIKRENGKMELKIITTGYVKGELKDNVLADFHSVYPNGFSDQGNYIDKNGIEWIVSVQIDMKDFSEYDGEGSIVDTDCLPPSGMAEWGVQGGSEVCAGAAGLALHGLWHNTGGDDCYNDDGAICFRVGLMKNPYIKKEDFFQIGFKLIDDVPEHLNDIVNVEQKSVTDYVQSKEPGFILNSDSRNQYFWDDSYPGGIDKLVNDQFERFNEQQFMELRNSQSGNQIDRLPTKKAKQIERAPSTTSPSGESNSKSRPKF